MHNTKYKIAIGIIAIGLLSNLTRAEQICRSDNIIENSPSSRYQVNQDGTLVDNQTQLMWKVCVEGVSGNKCDIGSPTTFNWASALLHPKAFNVTGFAGHKDWRLPNIRELSTLIELQCIQPSINTAIFLNAPSEPVWSSSPYLPGPDFYTWQVDFRNGAINSDDRTINKYVRLVRNSN
jgi:hypothetical protein